jgi:beta-glucanase (GH16 family)
MKMIAYAVLAISGVIGLTPSWCRGAEKPEAQAASAWKLVWSDEFDGATIDATKWDCEKGNGYMAGNQWIAGWGNGELEYYTKRAENVFVKDGMLHIVAVREAEPYKGYAFTSARIKTRKNDKSALFNKTYGRFEFRAKLPIGKGIWPAIWLLPQEEKYGGWASSGEIDVMEARGQTPSEVLGTIHYGSHWPANAHSGETYALPDHGTVADFHIYAVEWEPGEIRWYVDGKLYSTKNFWWSSGEMDGPNGVAPAEASELNPWPAPFDQPFHIILNVAVGGGFVGKPDGTTQFPAEMLVDYVRVYEKVGGYGQAKPRGAGKLPFHEK